MLVESADERVSATEGHGERPTAGKDGPTNAVRSVHWKVSYRASMSDLAIYRSTRFGRSTNFRIADSPTEIEVLAFGTQATTLTLSRTR